ncbi:MAG TPA: preprotein translocase subunit SecG [Candidatus Paceibacterota bacterium]
MSAVLPFAQVLAATLLVGAVLLQTSSAGIGALGGADSADVGFHTRRGPERVLFVATIVLGALFAAISFVAFRIG